MAKEYDALDERLRSFIGRQHMFFTASAAAGSRINISPRSTDCFRVLSDNAVCYLDRTGSGNETSAHIHADGRMTIMFCAVEGPPLILRLYGRGTVIQRSGPEYAGLIASAFGGKERSGARQIIHLDVELVKTSCGYGVPLYEYQQERETIERWSEAKGEEGLVAYRAEFNVESMDGLPTRFVE
jgi:hypothetical protein